MKLLVMMPYRYDTAPGQRFRIEQWARLLAGYGVDCTFAVFETEQLRAAGNRLQQIVEMSGCAFRQLKRVQSLRSKDWDAVFIYRELAPIGPAWLEKGFGKRGIPVIYDFDDAIFMPEVSDANRKFGWLKCPGKTGTICRLSAHVTVGNEYLAGYARRFNPNVTVIPTTIDTEAYTPKGGVRMGARPVIGWSGSFSTLKYMRALAPALRRLRRQIDFKIRIIGAAQCAMEGLDVEALPWRVASEVEDLQAFDIGLMPLSDDAWAKGKCGLKALQYMALGIPTVISPVGVNASIISDGENGFHARTEDEWVERLSALIRDEGLRERFAQAGRRTVEQGYSAKLHVPHLLEILQRVTGKPRALEAMASLPNADAAAVSAGPSR